MGEFKGCDAFLVYPILQATGTVNLIPTKTTHRRPNEIPNASLSSPTSPIILTIVIVVSKNFVAIDNEAKISPCLLILIVLVLSVDEGLDTVGVGVFLEMAMEVGRKFGKVVTGQAACGEEVNSVIDRRPLIGKRSLGNVRSVASTGAAAATVTTSTLILIASRWWSHTGAAPR